MSDHDTEDLVMESILALDRSRRSSREICEAIARLYHWQRRGDCSFTQFRVMPVLLRHGYTRVLELAEHPAYAQHRAMFDRAARSGDIAFVRPIIEPRDPDADLDSAYRDEDDGYLAGGKLYCDVGTRLHAQLAPSDPPLRERYLCEVVAWVIEAAPDNADLIAAWYGHAPSILFADRFTRRVHAGEPCGMDPFTGDELVATRDVDVPRPFTLDELLAVPEAIAIRDAGLRAKQATRDDHDDREDVVADDADDDDEGQAAALTPEQQAEAARWQARAEAARRDPRFAEARRVHAWWTGA